jgi:predicted anti-sigma-YlaC factor YlaD
MSAYLDGDIAPRQRARLERHLSECHDCRRVYGGLSRLVDALGRLERPQPGRDAVNISAAVRLRLDAP